MASWQNNDDPPSNTYGLSMPLRSPQRNSAQHVANSGQAVFCNSTQSATSPSRQLTEQSARYSNYNALHSHHTSPPHLAQSAYHHGDVQYPSHQQQREHQQQQVASSRETQAEPIAFFMFFNCKTTGSNIHRDKIVEIGIQCWPYVENAPVFHSKVDNSGGKHPKKQHDRGKKGKKKGSGVSSHPDDRIGHPFPVVWKLLMQWLERILDHATNVLGTQIYPVFVAHHGDTYDFHFLFRALETHRIPVEAPSNLDIHFCDPVPLLKQYKEYAHPWLVESRSMALGSLMNDWLPGQFDIGDLYLCLGKTHLAAKLYTQTPMYWLLKEFPLYTTLEWIEYYEEVKEYREDKKSLEDNFPENMPEVQRKFAVRSLLQWGYNWDRLLDLYKICKTPEQFRQELKDCDVKNGPASQLTWQLVDMKLPQDGTREYKVRIKKDMLPQRYTHLTDRRGRWWILRVKNELPPCIYSMNDLFVNLPSTSQWKVPENLLLIRYPEAWCPMPGDTPNAEEVIDQLQLGALTFNSDDDYDHDSCDSWDEDEDEEAAMRQALQPLEDLVKEQPAPPPITTLQFGDETTAYNPFAEKKQNDLQTELRKDNNAKLTKSLWDSVRDSSKQKPSSFGQAIKFCRPSGSEDQPGRKKDREEYQNNKNRKGQRNKRSNDKGNKGEGTYMRSQSWTPETEGGGCGDNSRSKQSKSRTISCSSDHPESWDDDSRFESADQTPKKTSGANNGTKGENAAAVRMINFHLAQNNKRPPKGRRSKNNRLGEKRCNSSQGPEEDQSRAEEISRRQHENTGGNNQTKSSGSSWGKGNKGSSPWGKGKSESNTDTSEMKQFPTKGQVSSGNQAPSSCNSTSKGPRTSPSVCSQAEEKEQWDEESVASLPSAKEWTKIDDEDDKRSAPSLKQTRPQLSSKSRYPASWGAPLKGPRADTSNSRQLQEGENRKKEVQNETSSTARNKSTGCGDDFKVKDKSCGYTNCQGLSKTKNPTKKQNKGKTLNSSQVEEKEIWDEVTTSIPGPEATNTAKTDDDQESVKSWGALSQSSLKSNSSGSSMRRPRETSKAHTVAQKARHQQNTIASKTNDQPPQKMIESQKSWPSKDSASPAFVESKSFWGNKHTTPNTSGFHGNKGQNKGAFRNDNNPRFGRKNINARGSKNDRSENLSISTHGNSSYGDNQPVVVNHVEESENWDEEIGDDECYGL